MQISRRVRRGAARMALLLVTAAGVLGTSALAANATVVPGGSTEIFHTCKVIGSDGTTQGVVCADLFSHPDGVGTNYYAQNEVVCQTISSGAFRACAGIHEAPVIGNPAGTHSGGQQICGTRFGHSACAAGRTIHVAPVHHSAQTGKFTCNIWAESVYTSIVLPGSLKTVSIKVLATPHHPYSCV
jgi:hypothetical protein